MKKVISFVLAMSMIFCMSPIVTAAYNDETEAAELLYELGLFKGTGTNPDGTPIFDLDKIPTRNQAVIMLVRLLGKEEEALNGNWELPFSDVAKNSVAYPYIGYAYANGLTNGTSSTTYSGTNLIRANQYITFILRALGYTSGEDFSVSNPYALAQAIGLTSLNTNPTTFTRGTVAVLSRRALDCYLKGNTITLQEKLGLSTTAVPGKQETSIPTYSPQNARIRPAQNIILDNGNTASMVFINSLVVDGATCVTFTGAAIKGIVLNSYEVDGETDFYIQPKDLAVLFAYLTGNYYITPDENPYRPNVISFPIAQTIYEENGKTVYDYGYYKQVTWNEYIDANTGYSYVEHQFGKASLTTCAPLYRYSEDRELVIFNGVKTLDGTLYSLRDILKYFGINKEPIISHSGESDPWWMYVMATLDFQG